MQSESRTDFVHRNRAARFAVRKTRFDGFVHIDLMHQIIPCQVGGRRSMIILACFFTLPLVSRWPIRMTYVYYFSAPNGTQSRQDHASSRNC